MIIEKQHGSGGGATDQLIREIFLRHLGNPVLARLEDAALLSVSGDIALTTDSFVITPLEFPGGDIGRLAVCGTVNDLTAVGAIPLYLTAGFILEEGLPLALLAKLVQSMAKAAEEAGVSIVAGDTKVIEGHGGLLINTSGLGIVPAGQAVRSSGARPGDRILVSGPLGDHQSCIMSQRLQVDTAIRSDVAPLNRLIRPILDRGLRPHAMRDVTRGGLAAILNELTESAGCAAELNEPSLPVRPVTRAFCDMLGLDPLTMANEGCMALIVDPADAEACLAILQESPAGSLAADIGCIKSGHGVTVRTTFGSLRQLIRPWQEDLPRIC
jgi:hydrogenase expression/formation protein HypE